MSFLDKFEQRVERAVNSTFSKVFRSDIKPVDLATALRREVDDRAAVFDRSRTVVPNDFTIELSQADFEQVESWGAEMLADELAVNVTEYAASQHYAFVGPVVVSFELTEGLETGHFTVRSSTLRGNVAPGPADPRSSRHPSLTSTGNATSSPVQSPSLAEAQKQTLSSMTPECPGGTWKFRSPHKE